MRWNAAEIGGNDVVVAEVEGADEILCVGNVSWLGDKSKLDESRCNEGDEYLIEMTSWL